MPPAPPPSDPPYRRIVAQLRAQILSGDLKPGDRVPSVRQVAQRSGVAVATATKAMATLREDGLIEARVGSGTVVATRTGHRPPPHPSTTPGSRPPATSRRLVNRTQVLRTAISIADVEGLDAVSMRRLATELGVGPMSLYRHVTNKDELVVQMVDEVFGEPELPSPGPAGWRPKLELISRQQWHLCQRHLWLPRAVSFTRPLLVPNMTAHTEWTLRALDGLGLPVATRFREALTLHALVATVAMSLADEVEAEQETGVTLDRWRLAERRRADDLLHNGRFPLLATVPEGVVSDLDGLFEYGLARHLDGFAALVEDHSQSSRDA